ncbi:hypothetical protein, partial [Staphylococcus aureus]
PCTIQFKYYKIILLYNYLCVNRFLLLPNYLFKSIMQCQSTLMAVSYTHLRAHETLSDLVCRLLLEKIR